MSGAPAVSVVLPTFNERETILAVLHELEESLVCVGGGWEAIVVDDDSPDRTWQLVQEHYDDDPRVRVVRRTDRSGLSSAVLDGFRRADGSMLVCMDADGQHPAGQLPALIEAADGGIAVGSRHCDGGSIDGWPRSRKVISAIASGISQLGIPSARPLSDPMSGYFAIDSQQLTEEVLEAADPHGYKILLELVVHTDCEISEVPITFDIRQGGESKLTVDEQVNYLEHTLDLGLEDRGVDVDAPILVRSLELGVVAGGAVLLLLVGIIVGGVDGAVGAGLIGGAGILWTFGLMRYLRTGKTWEDSTA